MDSRVPFLLQAMRMEEYQQASTIKFSNPHPGRGEYYHSDHGWAERKIYAIPRALYYGIIETIERIAIITLVTFVFPFVYVLAIVSSPDKKQGLFESACEIISFQVSNIARDIQESIGHLVTLFHDRLGQHIVNSAQFNKIAYEHQRDSRPIAKFRETLLEKERANFLKEYPIATPEDQENSMQKLQQLSGDQLSSILEILDERHIELLSENQLTSLRYDLLSDEAYRVLFSNDANIEKVFSLIEKSGKIDLIQIVFSKLLACVLIDNPLEQIPSKIYKLIQIEHLTDEAMMHLFPTDINSEELVKRLNAFNEEAFTSLVKRLRFSLLKKLPNEELLKIKFDQVVNDESFKGKLRKFFCELFSTTIEDENKKNQIIESRFNCVVESSKEILPHLTPWTHFPNLPPKFFDVFLSPMSDEEFSKLFCISEEHYKECHGEYSLNFYKELGSLKDELKSRDLNKKLQGLSKNHPAFNAVIKLLRIELREIPENYRKLIEFETFTEPEKLNLLGKSDYYNFNLKLLTEEQIKQFFSFAIIAYPEKCGEYINVIDYKDLTREQFNNTFSIEHGGNLTLLWKKFSPENFKTILKFFEKKHFTYIPDNHLNNIDYELLDEGTIDRLFPNDAYNFGKSRFQNLTGAHALIVLKKWGHSKSQISDWITQQQKEECPELTDLLDNKIFTDSLLAEAGAGAGSGAS